MRQPEFWRGDVSGRDAVPMLRALLAPISWAYAWAGARRIATATPRHASVPVVCVGNLTIGGAGKTPITRALRAKLGPNAHTLSRGYGGRLVGPLRVTPDMDAREVGDEPLLHAADGAAWIARDRVAGARAASNAGAHAIILDDGFQNPNLAKDLSLIAVDAGFGVGNGAVFPAGPLRERLQDGLARADGVILIWTAGASPADAALAGEAPAVHSAPDWLSGFTKPILHAFLEPTAPPPAGKLIAFAGIARPEKFFDTLLALGGQLEEGFAFADHHVFEESDLAMLAEIAEEREASLITTEKDHVRLSPEWRARVGVLPVSARFADEAALEALLAPIRARMGAAGSQAGFAPAPAAS